MKKMTFVPFVCLLLACSPDKEKKEQADVPVALQENHRESFSLISKKTLDNDLVEALYREKVRSTPALLEIETLLKKLRNGQKDSLETFTDFTTRNRQYYNAAKGHLAVIKDSVLKKEIEAIFEISTSAFDQRISGLTTLTTALEKNVTSAEDLHTTIMLLISLAMMKEYQDKNLPSPKPIESVVNDYTRLIQKMDSVIRKSN